MKPPPSSPSLFQLEAVTRRWGEQVALCNVSMRVEAGESIALVGPSGSGKTTLLRLLAGALATSEGSISVKGVDLSTLSLHELRQHRAQCGIVEQSQLLIPQLSTHGNVIAGYLPDWPWWKTALSSVWPLQRKEIGVLLHTLGVGDRQWDPVSDLSGGQQQRVAIARALIRQPTILLADEPTASLDPTTAAEVASLLVQQARERGSTLLFCTHHLSQVLSQVDRVIGLREGRVVLNSTPENVDDAILDSLYEGSRERR